MAPNSTSLFSADVRTDSTNRRLGILTAFDLADNLFEQRAPRVHQRRAHVGLGALANAKLRAGPEWRSEGSQIFRRETKN
jgi:hypothetical protein